MKGGSDDGGEGKGRRERGVRLGESERAVAAC